MIPTRTTNGNRYNDQVLLPHVCFFRGDLWDIFSFKNENATCHRVATIQDCLDSEKIQWLVWSSSSPDLNLFENVWNASMRCFVARQQLLTNKDSLIHALKEEWKNLPEQLLNRVGNMPRCVESYIGFQDGHILAFILVLYGVRLLWMIFTAL